MSCAAGPASSAALGQTVTLVWGWSSELHNLGLGVDGVYGGVD